MKAIEMIDKLQKYDEGQEICFNVIDGRLDGNLNYQDMSLISMAADSKRISLTFVKDKKVK